MADYRGPPYQVPHRKPLPCGKAGGSSGVQAYSHVAPDSRAIPGSQQQHSMTSHSRSRTTSSSVFPGVAASNPSTSGQSSPTLVNSFGSPRRLSNATSSTASTGGNGIPIRTTSNVSGSIRRSTSSRSSSSPTSYVALMRKQKATVWCDRSQHEDPRLQAQRRAAKMRATMEVHGGGSTASGGRTSTIGSGSMVGKIRHHGVPRAPGYTPATLAGAGVPMRLSANEVGNAEDGGDDSESGRIHQRSGSGRSSMGSSKFPSGYQRPQGRFSTGSTPPDGSPDDIPELAETPVPGDQTNDYFTQKSGNGESGSSGEREDSFGNLTEMAAPSGAVRAVESAKKAEELRRRGSVDDRSMTMSGVRLFVANPDLSD